MDIGAEISKKIQMAITAKLKELNAYVDDELPDYIMIMVANRKTEAQMTDALSLFLAENTKIFTSWLHNLLATLRKTKTDKAASAVDAKVNEITSVEKDAHDDEEKSQEQMKDLKEPSDHQSNTMVSHQVKEPVKSQEPASSEAVITISHETADILDEELLLNHTDSSILADSAPEVDVHKLTRHETEKRLSENKSNNENKSVKLSTQDNKETRRRLSESSRHRRESESKTSERKRRSDDMSRRRSHRSRSPVAKSRRNEWSRERKDSSRSKNHGESSSHAATRRTKHDNKHTYRLESDSKKYTRPERLDNKSEKSESSLREWDKGKGEDGDKEIISSWERRQRHEDKYNKRTKEEDKKWELSSDEDDISNKGKFQSFISSAIKPVSREPEFVSDSESDDGNTAKGSAVTSKIAYPERKMRVPTGKQANKALLIKAITAAERSLQGRVMVPDNMSEDEVPLIHDKRPPKLKRNIKSRLSMKNEQEWVENPVKVRRKLSDVKKDVSKNVIEKILTRPMYQDIESNGSRSERFNKEVIFVHKNIKTGNRISTTSRAMSTQSQEMDSQEMSNKAVRRRKPLHQKPTKVILVDEQGDDDSPLTVIHVRRKSQTNKREQVIYVDESSSDENTQFKYDKRNFIHKENSSDDDIDLTTPTELKNHVFPIVKFDSRRATPHSPQPLKTRVEVKKKLKATAKVSPRPQTSQSTKSKSSKVVKPTTEKEPGSRSPRFIVTLDGVAAPKQFNTEKVSDEKNQPKPSIEKFKFEPVKAPVSSIESVSQASPKTPISAPIQKPLVIQTGDNDDDHDDLTDTELMKMRRKLIKVQEEATKLKLMQAKLAAVRGLPTPGGMYADKLDAEQRSIYIGNVHYSVSEKQLSEYFSICGKVDRVTILKDALTGHPKGFAYMEFDDKLSVSSALALDNTSFNGRIIRVTLKQAKPAPVSTFRGTRPPRYMPRRSFPPRAKAKYFKPGFVPTAPRFRPVAPRVAQFPSRNKTWVNPAIAAIQK